MKRVFTNFPSYIIALFLEKCKRKSATEHNFSQEIPEPWRLGNKGTLSFPGGAGEENQNRENLQTAGQHAQAQNKLTQGAVTGKIAHRADGLKAGADIVEGAYDRREIRNIPARRSHCLLLRQGGRFVRAL